MPQQSKHALARTRRKNDPSRDLDEAKRLEKKRSIQQATMDKNIKESKDFNEKANKPYFWHDSSFWRLHDLRIKIPKDHALSFFVVLKKPLPKKLIDKKLEEAFGDVA